MGLACHRPAGAEIPVVITPTAVLDGRPLTPDFDGRFFADDGIAKLHEALRHRRLPVVPGADGLGVGAPVARPSAVVCIGMNYAAHAAESGAPPPKHPVLFLKTPNTVIGRDDSVDIPRNSDRTDWDTEFAVVVGQRTSYLDSPAQSLEHVAGFAVVYDLRARLSDGRVGWPVEQGQMRPRPQPARPLAGHAGRGGPSEPALAQLGQR